MNCAEKKEMSYQKEYLVNGDFECSRKELEQSFELQIRDDGEINLDNAVYRSGSQSLRMKQPYRGTVGVLQEFSVDTFGEKRYIRLSCDLKAHDVVPGKFWWETVRVWVKMYDRNGAIVPKNGREFELCFAPWLFGTFDWKTVERIVCVLPEVTRITCWAGLDYCSGTVWVDNLHAIDVTGDIVDPKDNKSVIIDINYHKVISILEQGFGWNWHFTSDKQFDKADMYFDSLFAHVRWDGTDWVRLGVNVTHWTPSNVPLPGQDIGQKLDYSLHENNHYVQRLCEVLDVFQESGIPVIFANWNTGGVPGTGDRQWLQRARYQGIDPSIDPAWFVPYSYERFAEAIAEALKYFIVERGYDVIKWTSIWNEPEGPWISIGKYPEEFYSIYAVLESKLKEYGLDKTVSIVGPEGCADVSYTMEDIVNYGQDLTAVAVHDYWVGFDMAIDDFPSWSAASKMASIEQITHRQGVCPDCERPIWFTEFGTLGNEVRTESREHFLETLSIVEYAIRSVASGVDGLLRWCYNEDHHCGDNQFTPFSPADYMPKPALYYGYSILTRWTVSKSKLLETMVVGSKDSLGKERVYAQAFQSPSGEMTIIVTNNSPSSKQLTIRVPSRDARWCHFYYDSELDDHVLENSNIAVENGQLVACVTRESINAFTTFAVGLDGDAPR